MVTECKAGDVYLFDYSTLRDIDLGVYDRLPVVVLSMRKQNVERNFVNVVPLLIERPSGAPLRTVGEGLLLV